MTPELSGVGFPPWVALASALETMVSVVRRLAVKQRCMATAAFLAELGPLEPRSGTPFRLPKSHPSP